MDGTTAIDFLIDEKRVCKGICTRILKATLEIPDSHYEKKNTQNEDITAHFEYFFTCHYSKTVWFPENLNEIKITHYEKIFSHIKQEFSYFEKELVIKNIFLSH